MTAMNLLRRQVEAKGQAAVARELGVSKAAISQILNGKYQASTEHIEGRIMKLYGAAEGLVCPHQGREISPAECADIYARALNAGPRATGNPSTLRQHHACRHCQIRS